MAGRGPVLERKTKAGLAKRVISRQYGQKVPTDEREKERRKDATN
jgi:hypothetical protein